ncbi:MAG: hypothetical protein EP319_12165 [Deltaproteobacteria bacterium]|nr:MAG: hypothetical protein EP319_12165 [Deltaproteobacteria bacterium]
MRLLCLIFIFSLNLMLVKEVSGKVDPPNYNFSLESLSVFQPEAPLSTMEEKFGKGELISESNGIKEYKFMVSHLRYKFPVWVQVHEGKSLDFFAKLPSYFLHDVFHQSLINRYGKQDKFFNKEVNSVYVWNNKNNVKHIYSGSCTITCFPIYYAGLIANPKEGLAGYRPLIEKFEYKEIRK